MSVPDPDLLNRLSDLADKVKFVQWDLLSPPPPELADQISVVQIGHYWVDPARWRRLFDLPALRYVLLPSAGFDHALDRIPPGVTLCNGRGVHAAGTAELAVGLILASQRGLVAAIAAQAAEDWSTPELPSLADRRVLVVGAGAVGQAVMARLAPFEVELTQVARSARGEIRPVSELPDLLEHADVVVLTVPHDDTTHHLLNAETLARLPDGALVVNVARGGVVATDALLAELTAGRLRAALDVTDPEPLPKHHPLWHAPNTIITAHQGGNSDATYPRVAALLRRQLEQLLAGEEPENVVWHS